MAIYHFVAQRITRPKGRGIVAAAAYRSGQKLLEEKTQTVYDYRHKSKIVHSEIVAPLCAPEWVYDREVLWNTVDKIERRKDARLARELLVALPLELTEGGYIDLVRTFVVKNFVREGMIADFAIHAPSNKKGGINFHAHILLSLRSINTEGFGNKVRQWDHVSFLYRWRKSWAEETNRMLELEGFECRIDHRSRATKEWELMQELETKSQAIEIESQLTKFDQDAGTMVIEDMANEDLIASDSSKANSILGDELCQEEATEIARQLGSEEWLDPQHNLEIIQEHRLLFKGLSSMKLDPEHFWKDSLEMLTLLTDQIKTRIENIETLCQHLQEGKVKEWLSALHRLESACLKQYNHQILADILEVKDAIEFASEISNRRHLAEYWREMHSKYLAEWHFHAVTDERYRPLTVKADKLINNLRTEYQLKLNKLYFSAKHEKWCADKLNNEIAQFKQQMTNECRKLLGLQKDMAQERILSR